MRARTHSGLALCALFLSASCSPSEPHPRPRLVVLFSTCTVNKSFLSPYDPALTYTPQLGRFAEEAVVFERHETETAQSGPAFASIFTGTQAYVHGIYSHPSRLSDESYLIAEAFAEDGWDCYYWWHHPMTTPGLNYAQGVPEANRKPWQLAGALGLTPEDPDLGAILARLAEDPDYRAFVQVSFTLTHSPYSISRGRPSIAAFGRRFPADASGPDRARLNELFAIYLGNRLRLQWNFDETAVELGLSRKDQTELGQAIELAYKSCVYQLDRYFGLLVKALEQHALYDESMIAFTSDHGEVLYRDNALFKWTHGGQLAPEELGVPLIIRAPVLGIGPGRHAGVTRSIDVFPTLAGLAGVPIRASAGIEGVDLSPSMLGEGREPELVALSHSTLLNPIVAEQAKAWTLFDSYFPANDPEHMWMRARAGDTVYKLRYAPQSSSTREVFDLAVDPEERRNIHDPRDKRQAAMFERLSRYRERYVEGYELRPTEPGPSRQEELEKLRSIGYAK